MNDVADDNQTQEPTPIWVDAAPFRVHTRSLISATGLPWRIIAAHADVSPRAVQTLLHGRGNSRPVPRLHISIARSLAATSVESIQEASTLQTDARPARALLQALTRLGVTPATASSYLSAHDWQHISDPTTLSCSVAHRAHVSAFYDLVTTTPPPSRSGPRGGMLRLGCRHVDCGPHGARLDRKQERWSLSFSSPTPPRTR